MRRPFISLCLLAALGCGRAAPDPGAVSHLAALRNAVAKRPAAAPFVFDRNGAPIALYRRATNDVVAANGDFAAFVTGDGDYSIRGRLPSLGGNATLETTLDPVVQRAAIEALGPYRGALVAIDPRTNEILAIASTGPSEMALSEQFEPGSVIKVLTGLNAFNSGANVQSMFPYTCKGELMIDGRHFGDWVPSGHGELDSIDDALAVSCNVFFADLGLRLGRENLRRFMTAAGFDGQANLGYAQVPLGRNVGDFYNNFEIAFYAIGLEHERMNALHVAMLASMMANRGVLTTPLLLRRRRSILGYVVAGPPAQGHTRLASPTAAETMIHAMQAVVNEPRGTGRRAPVEGISMALKTGTAGEKKGGHLQAVIMAFAPVEAPKIAFGIIAADAGPAEFAGAKIAHDFVEKLKERLE